MKKRNVIAGILSVLFLAVCLCGIACAELKKGSKGDEVKDMQQKLIDLGVLTGTADGAFGKKTEAAVKKLQKYWGLKQTGRADDDFLIALDDLWHLALGNGTESGVDPADLESPVMTCAHNESAEYGYDYCYRHDEGKALRDLLNPASGETAPEGLQKVILKRMKEYWLEQIGLTYDEWAESLEPDQQITAQEQKDLFEQSWAEMEAELVKTCGGEDKLQTLTLQAQWLELSGIEVCFDLHGAEPNTAE